MELCLCSFAFSLTYSSSEHVFDDKQYKQTKSELLDDWNLVTRNSMNENQSEEFEEEDIEERNKYAVEICKRIRDKLDGSDPDPLVQSSISDQVKRKLQRKTFSIITFPIRLLIRFEKQPISIIWQHFMKDGHHGCEKSKKNYTNLVSIRWFNLMNTRKSCIQRLKLKTNKYYKQEEINWWFVVSFRFVFFLRFLFLGYNDNRQLFFSFYLSVIEFSTNSNGIFLLLLLLFVYVSSNICRFAKKKQNRKIN